MKQMSFTDAEHSTAPDGTCGAVERFERSSRAHYPKRKGCRPAYPHVVMRCVNLAQN